MNSKVLYLNICQILATSDNAVPPWPKDYDRPIVVHVGRSTNNDAISNITVEYAGVRAKFFCGLLFDGTGDYGVSARDFFMPRVKLSIQQKALLTLSLLYFLITNGKIDATTDYFREKISSDINGGAGNVLEQFDSIYHRSCHHALILGR
jgi:hypothetical protein